MNGESVFGWVKIAALALAVLFVGYLAYKILSTFRGILSGKIDAHNPVGNAADSVVKNVTVGYESSVGGLFARAREYFSGDDAKIAMMKSGAPGAKPSGIPSMSNYVGDFPLGDIALPNPRDAR